MLERILTGRSFFLSHLSSFLNTGVMSACFSSDGNLLVSIQLLKFSEIKSENISLFNLIILVAVSVVLHVFSTFRSSIIFP